MLGNPAKSGLFPLDERVELLRAAVDGIDGMRVESVAGGLLVDYCRSVGASAIVKGLRSGNDFAYELPMALMNRHLTGIETVFIPGDPRFEHVSSSLVKEVAGHGGDVTGLVPDAVLPRLLARLGCGRAERGRPVWARAAACSNLSFGLVAVRGGAVAR